MKRARDRAHGRLRGVPRVGKVGGWRRLRNMFMFSQNSPPITGGRKGAERQEDTDGCTGKFSVAVVLV